LVKLENDLNLLEEEKLKIIEETKLRYTIYTGYLKKDEVKKIRRALWPLLSKLDHLIYGMLTAFNKDSP
jgi:hypothetical protein